MTTEPNTGYDSHMCSTWWEYVGPGHIPLLTAIYRGRVTRSVTDGISAHYWLDDQPLGTNQVRALAKLGLVDVPMVGAPSVTADGHRVLREWDAEEWWRRWRERTDNREAKVLTPRRGRRR
jgi:hypothetical protein